MHPKPKITLLRFTTPLAALLLWVAPAPGQADAGLEKGMTLSGLHITVGRAMSDIEAQSDYRFAFNMGQLDTGTPVLFPSTRLTIREALGHMFGDGRFKYVVRNRFIAVSPDTRQAERANAVAREMDNDMVTVDTVRYEAGQSASTVPVPPRFDEEPYEIERIVTVIPAETIERTYPASYSSYRPLERYPAIGDALPSLAVKVNVLYGAAFLAPNLAVEAGVGTARTVELSGAYSWKGRKAAASFDHKQLAHWLVRGEWCWWLCERFDGHYLGAHALFSRYYISGRNVPLLFDRKYSYDGWAVGAGATYGYHLALAPRWGLDLNVGAGYAYMKYDRGTCVKCDPQPQSRTKHYVGPTRAGINLVFLIR